MARPRRLRRTPALRDLVAETTVRTSDLIAPLFVREGVTDPQPIASLPGVVQHSPRQPARRGRRAGRARRPRRSILFGVPAVKDAVGSGAFDPDGIVQVALADLRADVGDDIVLIADLCVDEYTDHGHCGVLDEHGDVDNDATLEVYARAARGPGHGRGPRRRPERDDGRPGRPHPRRPSTTTGSTDVAILAYSAKYASGLYGPFRDAVDVTIAGGGDRKGYQQDWRNAREALARDRRRRRRGRRHGDGQAGARLPRRHRRRPPARRRAARRVPRERRVRDDQGGRRQRLDRRRRRRPRAPHGDQAGRRRRDPHVPRPLVRRGPGRMPSR